MTTEDQRQAATRRKTESRAKLSQNGLFKPVESYIPRDPDYSERLARYVDRLQREYLSKSLQDKRQ